jgi:hypothetical protein
MRTGRPLLALFLAALPLMATAGCTAGGVGDIPSPAPGVSRTAPHSSPTPSPSPVPTVSPVDPTVIFAADGIAGYQIGAGLTDLVFASMVTNVTPVGAGNPACANTSQAGATGVYAGRLTLTFSSGQLIAIRTVDPALTTPTGVHVGMAVPDLKSIYASRATQIGTSTLSVRVPATTLALVFTLDPTASTVTAMSAGQAQPLENAATTGQVC